ncbi:MAG TPA: bifunctional DNA-formamidopyrimidine glycosylase/DNA-(apurinic or apyrimidinic site) lyase [Pyrinomonadaceae bacterium]|nr:bifunctional DNA-formamidopyrimidine glycosylase/DNA-(apurinic or apyrimidinic site) lyase [Pyrinomonadaceae bacterium]
MPELPEVEHVVRALRRVIVGRRIVATQVRLPKLVAPTSPFAFNRRLKGLTITGVSRRGKFILIELNETDALRDGRASDTSVGREFQKPARKQGLVLVVHLRMTGKFLYLSADGALPKHAHAILYLDNDRRLVFRDQRKFGVMKLVARSRLSKTKGLSELAPEPMSDDFGPGYLKATLARSSRTLKTLLLDQTKVLGLGNIYAAEALFRAGINPFKIAAELSTKRVERLHAAILDVLRDAITDGSISRIDLERADGFSYGEAFERFWQVYEREDEPCFKCGARIRRVTHGGRSTYWCPRCQRR